VAASSSQIGLTWTASTDDTAVTGYNVYRDSVKVSTSATAAYTDTGLAGSTNYCYQVSAYDATLNESALSGQSCATTSALVVAPIGAVTGGFHSFAVFSDGSISAWGLNDRGQLGDGTMTNRLAPVVMNATGITNAAGGGSFSILLDSSGDVWGVGNNDNGQLGNGTLVSSVDPVKAVWLSLPAVSVATGSMHSLAVLSDGKVRSWGGNMLGQLGDSTTTDRTRPVLVNGVSGVVAVEAGSVHSVALKADGTVWSWGFNSSGQLGNGTTTNSYVPVQVSGLTNIVAISASGGSHNIALKGDGTVWVWGSNTYGQLGDGTTINRTTPVQVAGLSNIAAVAAGGRHSMAVKADGTVVAWGDNANGQLGDGSVLAHTTPALVNGLSGVSKIGAGYYCSVALKSNGTVWMWGQNSYGQIGDGTLLDRSTPVQAL
jgi:alpha-tubulin suppressor-like RCC1 family protein